MAKKTKDNQPTPLHQWINSDGEVYVLRFSGHDGRAYKDFQHPMTVGEAVLAPDFNSSPTCGGGIHGWPWGIGIGDGKEPDWSALWQVYGVRPEDMVGDVGGGVKCKFKTGVLRYKGDWHGAALFILDGQMAWATATAQGAATNSGDSGAATNSADRGAATNSGYSGAATNSGDSGAATNSADSGAATNSGYRGAATNSADRGAATNSGYRGAATNSGDRGAATNSGDSGAATNSADSGAATNSGYRGAATNSADRGAATNSGYRGAATNSGDRGAATNSADRGAATNSGYRGAATNSGYRGAATNSADSGAALNVGRYGSADSSGKASAAVSTGPSGRVRGGQYGCIALAWWNEKEQRSEMRCGEVGIGDGSDGKLKAGVWYEVGDDGAIQEAGK